MQFNLKEALEEINQSNTVEELAEIEAFGPDPGEEGYDEIQRAINLRINEFVKGKGN